MRSQNICRAIAKSRGPESDYLVTLLLVQGVWQRSRAEWVLFFHQRRSLRPVRRDAAGKNELRYSSALSIYFGGGFCKDGGFGAGSGPKYASFNFGLVLSLICCKVFLVRSVCRVVSISFCTLSIGTSRLASTL